MCPGLRLFSLHILDHLMILFREPLFQPCSEGVEITDHIQIYREVI